MPSKRLWPVLMPKRLGHQKSADIANAMAPEKKAMVSEK
jgi:hypothetical protein